MGDALFDEFRSFVEAEVTRLRVPGVAVGVLHDGVEHTAAFGVTSVDNPLPVDADTLFQVGSITKTFTATAAMRLVDQGRLELDRPLRAYLPELHLADPRVAATVTARHLMTHTAGWVGDYFADTGRGDDALARYVGQLADVEQLTPVGAVYSYCNSGPRGCRRRPSARLEAVAVAAVGDARRRADCECEGPAPLRAFSAG